MPLSSNGFPILGVLNHEWKICSPLSIYPRCSWRTPWIISLHLVLLFCLLFLCPLEIDEVCNLPQYMNHWFSIGLFQIQPRFHLPRPGNLYHPVRHILLSFLVFCSDSMHQTLHSRVHYLYSMLFLQSIILWIFRTTWNQPYGLKIPVMDWMESQCSCNWRCESSSHCHSNVPAHTVFSLELIGLIQNPNTQQTVWKLTVAWWLRLGC